MKDVYLQSGGVGLVHDLEGELSSMYGLRSYFGVTAFSFPQFGSYLSLLLNFHFSPFPSYFKMQAAFFFSDFDIPIVCVCVFQFVFHVLTITRHVDLSSQTRDQIHTAGTENVVLNGPPEKS